MVFNKLKIVAASAMFLMGIHSTTANAEVIELSLLLDGSGSVGSSAWNLQVNAYQSIFASGTFYDDYVVGGDTLWVNAKRFDNGVTDLIALTQITDNASATTFGNLFAGSLYFGGYTATKLAVEVAANGLLNNAIAGDRMIIDISTDGLPCVPLSLGGCGLSSQYYADTLSALATAQSNGVTTNFIGVGPGISVSALTEMSDAGGGFYTTANSFPAFQVALEDKLFREIQGVPAPAPLVLFGLGLLGLSLNQRRSIR